MYDWLVVGAGLCGATFANRMHEAGRSVLVIDKREHIGGNCYTEKQHGIDVHKYGPHIFHTSNSRVWEYVNRFTEFNNFVNRPKVNYNGNIYSFPINLFTLYQLFGVRNPVDAQIKLNSMVIPNPNPKNLEEWALGQVGKLVYETFIEGYTTKQWGRHPTKLPADIIKRLPIRLNFDDNYFTDKWQGIPKHGYTSMISNMLHGGKIPIELGVDFIADRSIMNKARRIFITMPIDEYFGYRFGPLAYRSLRFEEKVMLNTDDFQGNAVINYTSPDVQMTRSVEHKHFNLANKSEHSILTFEYPDEYTKGKVPYYPIRDAYNTALYSRYKTLAKCYSNLFFGGRLGQYVYMDMHQVINSTLTFADSITF